VAGSVVFTERVDRFETEAGHVDMPVVGVFEMADGKIAAWRDYFDVAMFTGQANAP
jgi:limonene-1,2-epoxide hydrolase